MHERECKGYISFNRGVNKFNRGVNELNRGVNDLNRGVNHSVARQGCNLLRVAVTSAVTSQGCCCGNLQINPLDLGHAHTILSPDKNKSATFLIMFKICLKSLPTLGRLLGDFC